MQPTGAELQRLRDALVSAYPTYTDLRMLARLHLDVDLDAIVPITDRNQTQIAYALVRHYAAEPGGLHRLLKSARAGNPTNSELVAAADLLAVSFDPLLLPADRLGARPPLWVNVPTLTNLEHIVGRADLVDDLVARLQRGQSPALSADGLPGVGKTTLAVLLAHDPRVRVHFSDGVLWAGLGPNPDVASVQAAWGDALGADLREVPDVRQRQERISAALADRRVLVVIDDAWQLEAAQTLRCSGPHVAHVLTTRNESIARSFAGATQAVKVPVLDDGTAWGLLQRLAPEACGADATAARELADAAGGLPLALELLGGYLAAPERVKFSRLSQGALEALKDPQQRLALAKERLGGTNGAQTLAAVIRLSVEDLALEMAEAVDAFYALGAFAPKPATFDLDAAEVVTVVTPHILSMLAARNLVEVGAGDTLAVHQVLHDATLLNVPGNAVDRHCTHYLALVNTDREDWQRIERILPQVQQAWRRLSDNDERMLEYLDAMGIFFGRRGLGENCIAWLNRALIFAKDRHDERRSAEILNDLGWMYSRLGEKTKALSYYHDARLFFRQVGDKGSEAITLSNMGRAYSALGEKAKALTYYDEALPLHRQVTDKAGEASTLTNMGRVHADLGDNTRSLECYAEALTLQRQVGDKAEEANTLGNIGNVYSALGEKAKALEYYGEALKILYQVGDKVGEARNLNNMGRVYDDIGDPVRALEYFADALLLQRETGDRWGEVVTRYNIAMTASNLGDLARSEAELEIVVAIEEAVSHPDVESDRVALAKIQEKRRQQQANPA